MTQAPSPLPPPASPPGARYAIAAARFNSAIVEKLVAGALAGFAQVGLAERDCDLVWVPGSFELPLAAQSLARTKKYAAVLCLGCVIRGDTDHYDYVCRAAAEGILRVSLDEGLPVLFGVLTCDTEEQALARCGGAHGNKGTDAALAAVAMAGLMLSCEAEVLTS